MQTQGSSVTEEVRHPSADELGHIHQICGECWAQPFESPDTKEMPHFAPREPRDASMLFVDGEPASCVVYGRRELQVGPARLRLGALGDVATKTPYQRRGYASRLMVEAVRRMSARGDHVSALFTFSYEYYRRFGWEVAGDNWGLFLKRAEFGLEQFALPEYQGSGLVRPYVADDIEGICRLHAANLSERGWGLVRPDAYWQWVRVWLDGGNCVVVDRGNGLEGYLVVEVTPRLQLPDEFTFRRNDDPLWHIDVGPILHVVEMVHRSRTGRRALVGYLARRAADVAALAFPLSCRSDLAASGLLVPAARLRVMPSFMFRVLDVAEAVGVLSDLPAPDEPFTLIIDPDPAGINHEPVVLRPVSGRLVVVPGLVANHHHVKMGIQAFSQIFAGYRRASDLCALGLLEATSERAVALADQVFIAREPFLGELDLF